MPKYRLTYRGPSGLFIDPTSGQLWEMGQTQEVSEAAARRCCPVYFEKPAPPPQDPRLAGGPQPKESPSPHAARWILEPVEPEPVEPEPEPKPAK